MGRRITSILLSALVVIGALFLAQSSRVEKFLLHWLESEAKEIGVGFSADHVSLAFSGASPGLDFQNVKISWADGNAGQVEAQRLEIFYNPGLVRSGAVVARAVDLRSVISSTSPPSAAFLRRKSEGALYRKAGLTLFEPVLSDAAPGQIAVSAPRAAVTVERDGHGEQSKSLVRVESAGKVFELALTPKDESKMDWSASLAQPGGKTIATSQGTIVSREQDLEIRSEVFAISEQPVEGSAFITIGSDRLVKVAVRLPRMIVQRKDDLGVALGVSSVTPEVRIGDVGQIIWPGLGPWRLDATLECAELALRGPSVRNLRLRLISQDREFDLRVMSDDVYRGNFRARYVQDGQAAHHQLSASISGADVKSLLSAFSDVRGVEGTASARADLQGSGREVADVLRSAEGSADVAVERASVDIGHLASSDIDLLDLALRSAPPIDIAQATGAFVVKGGHAQSGDLAFLGPNVRGSGAGTIDVHEGAIDFRVTPIIEIKGRQLQAPFRVSGPWRSPQISADSARLLDANSVENIGGFLFDQAEELLGGRKSEKRGGR
jgi:hypothetical protein